MSHPLYTLLRDLENASIHFTLVGERVEIDVFEDGHMEVSRFPGREDIVGDESLVRQLIAENNS